MKLLLNKTSYSLKKINSDISRPVYLSGEPLGYLAEHKLIERPVMLEVLSSSSQQEIAEICSRSFGSFAWICELDQSIQIVTSPSHPGIFYHCGTNGELTLSEDLANLAATSADVNIDPLELLRYIPGIINGSCFNTIFKEIKRIPGNIVATISSDGAVQQQPLPVLPRLGKSIKDYFDIYFDLLKKYHESILIYSSGGIDSAAILSSVGKNGQKCSVVNGDESPYRQEVALRVFRAVSKHCSMIEDVMLGVNDSAIELSDEKASKLAENLSQARFDTLVKTNYFRTSYKIKTADIRVATSGKKFGVHINGYGADELVLGEKTGPDLSSIYSGTADFYIQNALRPSPFSLISIYLQYYSLSYRRISRHNISKASFANVVAAEVSKQFCFFGKAAGAAGAGKIRALLENPIADDAFTLAMWIVTDELSTKDWHLDTYMSIVRKFVYFHVTHIHVMRYSFHAQRGNALFEFPYLQGAILNEMMVKAPLLSDMWSPKKELYKIFKANAGVSYLQVLKRARAVSRIDLKKSYIAPRQILKLVRRVPFLGKAIGKLRRPSRGMVQNHLSSNKPIEVQGVSSSLVDAYRLLSNSSNKLLVIKELHRANAPQEIIEVFENIAGCIHINDNNKVFIGSDNPMNQRELLNWMHLNVFLDIVRSTRLKTSTLSRNYAKVEPER